jgi:hypothetical protein
MPALSSWRSMVSVAASKSRSVHLSPASSDLRAPVSSARKQNAASVIRPRVAGGDDFRQERVGLCVVPGDVLV